MFYKNKLKKNSDAVDYVSQLQSEIKKNKHINNVFKSKTNLQNQENLDFEFISNVFKRDNTSTYNNKLKDIFNSYVENNTNEDIFFEDFKNSSIYSPSVESQISELSNNVSNLLKQGNKELIKHALEQILEGKENISRFLEKQKGYIDENSLNLINLILKKYLHCINHLNKALEVL